MEYNDGTNFGNDMYYYQEEPLTYEETQIGQQRQLTTVHEQPLIIKSPPDPVIEFPSKKIIEPFIGQSINWNMFLLFLIFIVFAMQIRVMATLDTYIAMQKH